MKLFRASLVLGLGALVLAGCDLPTDTPNLEQRWVLPVETTTISVDELLPAGLAVSGSNFTMSVDPFFITRSLADVCGGCSGSGGLAVPYPGFTSSFGVDQTVPADVSSADLAGGTVGISVQNGFSFDPIRLPSGATGSITITLTNGPGGAQLGQVVIDGATEALPANSTVNKTITVASATVGATISATIDMTSPAGTSPTDDVAINTGESLTVTATPTSILIASATVSVDGQTVDFDAVDFDAEDMDESFTDRIQQGSVILDVVNPFGVSVTGTLDMGNVSKPFSVPSSATSQVSIAYTGEELRSFLGQSGVQFSGSGSVSAAAPITVSPGQEVTLKASIDLTLLIG